DAALPVTHDSRRGLSCLCHCYRCCSCAFFFFFNHSAPTEIYTLSLHDALPIYRCGSRRCGALSCAGRRCSARSSCHSPRGSASRSEEHTSELQSLAYLVCRLLLEKKKKQHRPHHAP